MDIGFIGLGKMGFPMARRLIEAKHQLVVFDQPQGGGGQLVALGAQAASSPKDVADRAETVMASLPSLQASLEVATGTDGVIEGKRVKRFVDLDRRQALELGPAELKQICTGLQSRAPQGRQYDRRHDADGDARQGVREAEVGVPWLPVVCRRRRDAAASGLVGKLVDRLFDGSTERLVAHLIEAGKLTRAEQTEITSLIEQRRGGQSPFAPKAPQKGTVPCARKAEHSHSKHSQRRNTCK